MFCAMAMTTAKPGRVGDIVRAAQDHAAALREQPGCQGAYVLVERGRENQVMISLFESEESFRKAAAATLPVINRHAIEQFLEGPPAYRLFDVR